jgi:hypothetical protein
MLVRQFDYVLNLIVISWVNHDVRASGKGTVPQSVNLCEGGTVRVHNALPLEETASIEGGVSQFLEEGVVEMRGMNLHVALFGSGFAEINARILLGP